jgi:hypothetical protein
VADDETELADDLTEELARKYDPERLLKLVSKRAGRGDPLDQSVRAKYEKRFGVDLSHVRVYTGEFAEEFNRQRNAYAVTIGTTGMILMGGSPDRGKGSIAGEALLAHELTHVAQARRGMHYKSNGGMPFAQEHEAEAEATEAAIYHEATGAASSSPPTAADAAQREQENEEKRQNQIEKIKQRVIDLMGDAAHAQELRNGPQARRA